MRKQHTENKLLDAPTEDVSEIVPPVTTQVLKFGGFEAAPSAEELRRGGRRIPLQPKPLRLLVLLASRPGQIVTRDEIRRALWPAGTYVDHQMGINFCIRQLRQALGDSTTSPRFVETIRGKGYRFLADVVRVEPNLPMAEPLPAPDVPDQPRWRRTAPFEKLSRTRLSILTGLLFTLLLTAFVWLFAFQTGDLPSPDPSTQTRPRLAVLAFEARSNDPQSELLATVLTEELTVQLTRSFGGRDLDILGLGSMLKPGEPAPTPGEVARRLQADILVTGSVHSEDDVIRVTARLIEIHDGVLLWSGSYQRDRFEKVLDLRVSLAEQIAEALGLSLDADTKTASLATAPADARVAYWMGRRLLRSVDSVNAELERSHLLRAREHIDKALSLDPSLAPAYVELGRLEIRLRPLAEAESHAREALRKALALDDALYDAHSDMALLHLLFEHDVAAARREATRAVASSPGEIEAQFLLATCAALQGDHDTALRIARKILSLNPMDEAIATDACWFSYYAGHWQEAVMEAQRALALKPTRPLMAYRCWLSAESVYGESRRALEPARLEMSTYGATTQELEALENDDPKIALQAYWRWRLDFDTTWADPGLIAQAQVALGHEDSALSSLEQSFALRGSMPRLFIGIDPLYAPLQQNPRFALLLGRLAPGTDQEPAPKDATPR